MVSEKSVSEREMEKLLIECETIVDESYLTTNDAKKIITAGSKLLAKCKELRESRDKIKRRLNENKTRKQMRILQNK